LFFRSDIAIQIDKVAFEEDSGHLSVAKFLGIDEDECEGGNGGLVFGVGFEYFGGGLDFFVIT
jgi:hypothetical protein